MSNGSPPTLSIVIPTRNTKDLTLRCLGTLEESNGFHLEIIVVDDAGSDGTAERIASDRPEVTLLRNASNLGFSASANRGLDRSRGELKLLLNSDTELPDGSLQALVEQSDSLENGVVIGGQLYYLDGQPQWSGGADPSLWWLQAVMG